MGYPTIETLKANPLMAILTGHTCGEACWHAREEVCRCSCGGKNHGILRTADGIRPTRTRKIDGNFYELAAICLPWTSREEERRIMDERFPGLDWCGYGEFRKEKTMPVLARKISEGQAKWPEVQAIKGATYLIWARPVGTRYLVRGPNHRAVYADAENIAKVDPDQTAGLKVGAQ